MNETLAQRRKKAAKRRQEAEAVIKHRQKKEKEKRQELDALVDILNLELKEEFDYVPLHSVIKIAERLLEKGITLKVEE